MSRISINEEQRLYVISGAGGVSCFGFDQAHDHTNQIADLLHRPDLAFRPEDHAAMSGYDRYLRAVDAWSRSALAKRTWFDPGTDPRVARVLEDCRRRELLIRLVFGDTETGASWLDEHDVVGRVGRSTGSLKAPLLVRPGEDGGGAILTAWILAIVAWQDGRWLYRHPSFRAPELSIRPSTEPGFGWEVLHDTRTVARFNDIGQAGGYVAFMRGATVEPRVFR